MSKSDTRPRVIVLGLLSLALAFLPTLAWFASSVSAGPDAPAAPGTYQLATESENIRVFSQPANDLVFNPADGKIYASVPNSAGSTGNSIRPIDPQTGVMDNSVFVGSEPNKLALSNDGQSLYVSLNGAFAVRRFNTATQTAGIQFNPGYSSSDRYSVGDLAVSPDNPDILAVSRMAGFFSFSPAGVVIFNNGSALTQILPNNSEVPDSLAFSDTGSTLYGAGQRSGLKKITVTGSGASIASSSQVARGFYIKHSAGKVFSSGGHVADGATSTLLGTFPGAVTRAFVPDTGVGRAYYLVKDTTVNDTWILKAFDINTFALVGDLTISGVSGDAGSLIRWGGNGLAFRTTAGQLFILQTDLIPSGDPIPTPTVTPTPAVTPTPTPFAAHFGSVPVRGNAVVYNQANQKMYISVPSSQGSSGNSIATIVPETRTIENMVYVGSEPNKLALAGDNQKLYVGLDGARQVREFNVTDQTAGAQYPVFLDASTGPLQVADIAVSPDTANQIAVGTYSVPSTSYEGAVVIDNGVARPQKRGRSTSLAFSPSSSTLYGGQGNTTRPTLETMPVGPSGIPSLTEAPFDAGKTIRYRNGLIYSSRGQVIDPVTGAIAGTFDLGPAVASDLLFNPKFVVDIEHNRIFYVIPGPELQIRAFDLNTFLPIGTISTNTVGTPTGIDRWGTNGLAISHSNGPVLLIKSTLVDPTEPVPAVTPTPFPPTPTPPPSPLPVFVRQVEQLNSDMALNPADGNLYVSVPDTATDGSGGTITRISPQTGEILSSTFVGSDPGKIGLADDGQTLYVALNTLKDIRRFDISTQTAGIQFPIDLGSSPLIAQDLTVVPGNPNLLVVSTGVPGTAIYDNGVKRPNIVRDGVFVARIGSVDFSTPTSLYAFNNQNTAFNLFKVSVDASGLTTTGNVRNLISGFEVKDIRLVQGKIYTESGRVVDPEAKTLTGTFPDAVGGAIAVDAELRRVFLPASAGINVYDMDTYLKVGTISLPSVGMVSGISRWGVNGLAVRIYMDAFHQHILLIQSPLVSTAVPVPVGFNLNASAYTTSETSGERVISVTRTGEYNTPVTVHYETVDGTALAGSDYTASSGTLSFGPGEVSKSFSVPIVNDNVFDPGESFTVKLTDPAGGEAYLLNPSTATVAITDNDSRPGISDENVLVNETHTGSTAFAIVNVRLTNPSTETVSVNYATANGTAVAGLDYQAASGALSFAPGETLKTVPINIIGDGGSEGNENFFLNLSGAVNGTIVNSQATVTIIDYISPHRTAYDFDGDHKADVSLFRPSEGNWYMIRSSDGFLGFHFGLPGDKLVPEEYDNDGRQDIAVFRPSEGTWYIQGTASGFIAANFGIAEDIPQPGDFNGDGKAEIAVFRPSEGNWYTMDLVTGETTGFHFGTSGDKPVVGDYDGDGKMDYAVYRPSEGNWYVQASTAGFIAFHFGVAEDLPVQADYDGDGKTDYGVFRPSEGNWYLMKSTEGFTAFHWGLSTDLPVPADYDGDAKADIGVYRNGEWYLQQSTNGYTVVNFGLAGDKPAPNAFVY